MSMRSQCYAMLAVVCTEVLGELQVESPCLRYTSIVDSECIVDALVMDFQAAMQAVETRGVQSSEMECCDSL